jgi:hypothetical protein
VAVGSVPFLSYLERLDLSHNPLVGLQAEVPPYGRPHLLDTSLLFRAAPLRLLDLTHTGKARVAIPGGSVTCQPGNTMFVDV